MSQKQAKKRRREERARAQREAPEQNGVAEEAVRDLEEILKTGDIDDYAQLCWSLANNMEDTPRAGTVITHSIPRDEHGPHERRFRLTLQSMMTISQCAGMETCGEAIRLVASKIPPEQLPCYEHGHGEQSLDYFLHGIKPHECVYCGEIPNFTMPSMSIDWTGGIPVKGIDGQEYRTCPNCGSEWIELQGEEIYKWGWKIACWDCGWEIKQAELLDVEQYCELMEQTKRDLAGASQIMESTSINLETRIETAAVQTRKILEKISYATLVSNKDAGAKTQEELQDLRYPKDIFRDIGKVHPNFFPKPVEIREPSKGRPFVVKTKNVMTKEKLLQVYRELNPMAHSANPMAESVDLQYFEEKIPVWLNEIANTLDTHQVMLPHHPEHFYIVKMRGDRDGSVQCTPFTKDEAGTFTCAWPDCVSDTSRLYCEFWGRPWSECTLPEKEPAQTQEKAVGAMLDEEVLREHAQELLDRAGETETGSGPSATG